jgi:hypothetical protein
MHPLWVPSRKESERDRPLQKDEWIKIVLFSGVAMLALILASALM